MLNELSSVAQAVCVGLCVCGLGIVVLIVGVLSVTGRGILSTVQDILGVGQRDEDDLIDQTMESIQQKRQGLAQRRQKFQSQGAVPDFDSAVQKYAQQKDGSDPNLNDPLGDPRMRRFGTGKRFGDTPPKPNFGGTRDKRFDRDDEYEIYDDDEF